MSEQAALRRQKLLKRIFPALVLFVAYFGFIGPKISARVADAESELERKKQQYLNDQTRLRELGKHRNELLAELDALRRKGDKAGAETVRYIGFQAGSEYSAKAIGRLNELLAQQGLRVIEDGRQDWNSAKEKMPATVFALGEQPAKGAAQSGQAGASVWKLKFAGPYPSVYRLLENLSRDEITIVPISLEMSLPEKGGDMEWTLLIWI